MQFSLRFIDERDASHVRRHDIGQRIDPEDGLHARRDDPHGYDDASPDEVDGDAGPA